MTSRMKNVRLYVVGVAFSLVTLSLWGRLVQVQVFARSHYDSLAVRQGKVRREVPAVRGCIFDRSGRPLALSVHSFSVAVQPRYVQDREKVAAALSKYLSVSKKSIRDKLRSDKGFIYVKRRCPLTKDAQEKLKSLPGVVVDAEADRVYPYGATAAKIVGFVGIESRGMAGIEAALDAELRGEPGWEVVQRDGCYRSRGYQTYAEKRPVNGKHVFLTIDARLQEIAEAELDEAVIAARARGGSVVMMHCETGEVLAIAENPSPKSRDERSRADSLWTLRSVSWVYEPGSTFKLITAAALLESKKIRSTDVFDAENGEADMGVAKIRDAHPFDRLTFKEGFVQSSNVVMAKASLRLEPREFVGYMNLFGFGAPTGIEFLGESGGRVAPVEQWSKRTQMTMAFGQEVAATALQVAASFATVANDGVLVMPRIVARVEDETGGKKAEVTEPVELRRVISEDTARELREYMRAVVLEGTGAEAALEYLETAGKTGTGQKSARRGGYLPGKFVASFAGFAPFSDPKVVCLVLLDEPNWANRFGGVSAAPAFAKIVGAMATSSHVFDGVLKRAPYVEVESGSERFAAPNFLRMSRDVVMERARMFDLNLLCKGETGEVVAQDPDPGVAMSRSDVLRVYLSGTSGEGDGKETPDLRGLAVRAARRCAAEAGFKCEVQGSGLVVSQWPAPGAVSRGGVIRIRCEIAAARKPG
jgi:cell division protein FtsI/penicillin-binding protein 2